MTDLEIQRCIDAIKRATEKALRSKESAHKFLVDAGIVKERLGNKPPSKKKK